MSCAGHGHDVGGVAERPGGPELPGLARHRGEPEDSLLVLRAASDRFGDVGPRPARCEHLEGGQLQHVVLQERDRHARSSLLDGQVEGVDGEVDVGEGLGGNPLLAGHARRDEHRRRPREVAEVVVVAPLPGHVLRERRPVGAFKVDPGEVSAVRPVEANPGEDARTGRGGRKAVAALGQDVLQGGYRDAGGREGLVGVHRRQRHHPFGVGRRPVLGLDIGALGARGAVNSPAGDAERGEQPEVQVADLGASHGRAFAAVERGVAGVVGP